MRKHNGEKPFMCEKCGFSAKTRNTYKRHMKKQHNITVKSQFTTKTNEIVKRKSKMDDESSFSNIESPEDGELNRQKKEKMSRNKVKNFCNNKANNENKDFDETTLEDDEEEVNNDSMLSKDNLQPSVNHLFLPSGAPSYDNEFVHKSKSTYFINNFPRRSSINSFDLLNRENHGKSTAKPIDYSLKSSKKSFKKVIFTSLKSAQLLKTFHLEKSTTSTEPNLPQIPASSSFKSHPTNKFDISSLLETSPKKHLTSRRNPFINTIFNFKTSQAPNNSEAFKTTYSDNDNEFNKPKQIILNFNSSNSETQSKDEAYNINLLVQASEMVRKQHLHSKLNPQFHQTCTPLSYHTNTPPYLYNVNPPSHSNITSQYHHNTAKPSAHNVTNSRKLFNSDTQDLFNHRPTHSRRSVTIFNPVINIHP